MHSLLPSGSRGRGDRLVPLWRLAWVLLVLGGCGRVHPPAAGPGAAGGAIPAVLEVRDFRLLPALRLLLDRSPELTRSLEGLGAAGPNRAAVRIRVHSYESAPQPERVKAAFAYGYTHPFYDEDGRVDSIDVAIQWGRLQFAGRALGLNVGQVRTDIAVLLGHELFGHAVPLLQTGTAAGECADVLPAGGSCSLPRENAIRAALGVAMRSDYQLVCLEITRARDLGVEATRIPRGRGCATLRPGAIRTPGRSGA